MVAPYTGGCQCGQIRYEIRAEPLTLYACHCKKNVRNNAFGMSMPVPVTQLSFSRTTETMEASF